LDKGIRPEARRKFIELSPQRAELGNKAFRKAVIDHLIAEFGITLASAATHYNDAFKHVKAIDPALVDGLGRPEDKKGGRKKKVAVEAAPVEAVPQVQTFTVKKKSDGTVVAEGLSFEDAAALVDKAKRAKKASLYWV